MLIFFQLLDVFLLYVSLQLVFLNNVANVFSNFIIFIKKLSPFYQKIHTFSFIRISSIYTHFWMEYTQRSNFLASL